ncbi:hypothetical protein Sste5346_008320 [Sporothrix stenoceras]|uniref:Zn(2)-C6 fungal-type domain-containing protein n=1 Tax=Sporothrix stenoceras TaxID=5173 RepID=A0ABR3YPM3_9PEZI
MSAQTATPAQSPTTAGSSSKRCSMACTTCRQVKLRCDAAQRYPSPCSRCEKRRKTCVFDSEFKRRPVRGALERLLEEKEQLKQIVDSLGAGATVTTNAGTAPTTSHITPSQTQSEASPVVHTVDDTPGYDLDGVRLGFAVVDDLFEFYTSVFLPMLPILDITSKSPAAVCADSELLFWTILITAAQNHPEHRISVFVPLVTPYRRLLADALVRPARTVYMTQALLIVTAWPLSVEMQRNDPSWYYCGFAASSAIHLRLHEAEALWWYSSAGGREEVVAEGGDGHRGNSARYRTWLGAFVVSNTLSIDMGLPSPMGAVAPLAQNLLKQLGDDALPEVFAARIELQSILFRSDTILKDTASSSASFSSRNPLLDVLERELDSFEQKWTTVESTSERKKLPLTIHLDLLGARLRLRAPLLMPRSRPGPTETTSHMEPDIFAEAAWQKTVHYAGQIVQLMADYLLGGNEVDNTLTEDKRNGQPRHIIAAEKRCLPKHYYRVLLMAVFALLIYVMLHQKRRAEGSQDEVFTRALAYTRQAPDLIQALSRHPADEHGRCARFLRLVAHYVDDPSLANDFADDFARALAPPVNDIIEVGIKASWVIRQRVRQKYLEGPDRDLPRRQPAASTPSTTAARRTRVTRSSTAARFAHDPMPPTQETREEIMNEYNAVEMTQAQPLRQTPVYPEDAGQPFGYQVDNNRVPPAQDNLGLSDELFTDWNAWFDDADDFMSLFRAPTWNPM